MTIARRVFAVSLDPVTGQIEENGWEAVPGLARTAEEAADRLAAAGWAVAVLHPTTAPGEVVGWREDVWAVPAYRDRAAAAAAAALAADLVAADLAAAPDRIRFAVHILREADGGHAVDCEWSAASAGDHLRVPLPLARAAIAAYSRAAIEAARDALPWVIAAPDGRVADDLGPGNLFAEEDEAEAALDNLCSTCADWDLSEYFVRRATCWEVR